MGQKLKRFEFDDGTVVVEKACESYVCRYCKAKASACNYVGDMCLEVHVRHVEPCSKAIADGQAPAHLSECITCLHRDNSEECPYFV